MKQFFESTKPGGQLLALLLLFVIFFIIAAGCSAFAMLFGLGVDSPELNDISQVIMFAATAIVFAALFYGRPLRHLQMVKTDRMAVKMSAAFVILIAVLPFADWLTQVNDAWHFPSRLEGLEAQLRALEERSQSLMEVYLMRDGNRILLSNAISLALVPAICEELFFRGALQQLLCRSLRNHHVAIVLTAVVFSLLHGEVFAFLPRFVLGLVLGYVFYYGGSLWINILVHFTNNLMVVVLYRLASQGVIDVEMADSIGAPWYVILLGLAIAIWLFWIVFLKKQKASVES